MAALGKMLVLTAEAEASMAYLGCQTSQKPSTACWVWWSYVQEVCKTRLRDVHLLQL